MSKGSGSAAARRKAAAAQKKKKKEELNKKRIMSSSSGSSRGERERIKWRKKRRELELKKAEEQAEQHRLHHEAELAKRANDQQKKDYRKRHELYEKVLLDAESVQKAVEAVMSDYRESRNAIKVQLYTDSNDFIQTQQIEKSHLNAAMDRIRASESQLATLELELSKTKQIRDDYMQDSMQGWLARLWKYLY